MAWFVIRLEDRETGDSTTYGPFRARDAADLAYTRVTNWLERADTLDEISVSYERVHPFSHRAVDEGGWLDPAGHAPGDWDRPREGLT